MSDLSVARTSDPLCFIDTKWWKIIMMHKSDLSSILEHIIHKLDISRCTQCHTTQDLSISSPKQPASMSQLHTINLTVQRPNLIHHTSIDTYSFI